jgi:hypothetical protein
MPAKGPLTAANPGPRKRGKRHPSLLFHSTLGFQMAAGLWKRNRSSHRIRADPAFHLAGLSTRTYGSLRAEFLQTFAEGNCVRIEKC